MDYNFLLDIIFPKKCLGCKKQGFLLCPECLGKIPECAQTPNIENIDRVLIAGNYKNSILKNAIFKYKYGFAHQLSKPLTKLLLRRLVIEIVSAQDIILIPVPLHKSRLRWRSFNQSELLAKNAGQELNLSVETETLKRIKKTAPQAELKNEKERRENIRGAFYAHQSQNIKGRTVILIDDVIATGNTLCECAKTLKPLKPKEIWALTVAGG